MNTADENDSEHNDIIHCNCDIFVMHTISSSSEDENDIDINLEEYLKYKMTSWINQFQILHNAVKVSKANPSNSFESSTNSIRNSTPGKYIFNISGGKYRHFGVRGVLEQISLHDELFCMKQVHSLWCITDVVCCFAYL